MWPIGSKIIAQFSKYKITIIRTGDPFYVMYTKMLSFSLVAETLTGLIYPRPSGENSNFQFRIPSIKFSLLNTRPQIFYASLHNTSQLNTSNQTRVDLNSSMTTACM